MNKTTQLFALFLICSLPSIMKPIPLQSTILANFDGFSFGINGDTIAMIKQYQSQIRAILLGKLKSNNTRKGWYLFEGGEYSLQELISLEEQHSNNPRFRKLLKQMRIDFEEVSEPFKKIVGNVKSVMAILIDESCEKRKRNQSLLKIWAHTDQIDEYELFDMHVKNLQDFAIFLTDLYNFLGDLVESCPHARRQFAERLQKYKRVQELLPQTRIPAGDYAQLFDRINAELMNLQLKEITPQKIEELANQ